MEADMSYEVYTNTYQSTKRHNPADYKKIKIYFDQKLWNVASILSKAPAKNVDCYVCLTGT
jgi:hypothetical protein